MKATYNITTNRFKVWFDARLTPEQYAESKRCNFVWYPGQKCFSSIWYPQAEDFIKSFGIEIEEDDTPDDVEARVNRFDKYAQRAETDSERSADYASRGDITPRRAEAAERRATTEAEKAAHWNQRIAGAISNAQYKDRPDVIARRIKKIETDLHRAEREIKLSLCKDGNYLNDNHHWVRPEEVETVKVAATRWIEHYTRRLEYEKAYLDAVGGTALLTPEKKPRRVAVAPDDGLKKGVTVLYREGYYQQGKEHTGKVVSMGAHYVKVEKPIDAPEWYPEAVKVRRADCKVIE
jgi:hypothetical protein